MRKLFTLTMFGLCWLLTFSWSAHELFTYLLVKDFLPNADKLIRITPYDYTEKRIYNREFLRLDDYCGEFITACPLTDTCYLPPDPKPVDGKVPVWQILMVYSVEPDLGMDEGLQLSSLQSIIGNSQGVRHMKYNIAIFEFFEGTQSFYYFVEMSRQAFMKGDEYWGYRFLARALHHLQDLSMPYHNAPGGFFDTLRSLTDKQMAQVLSNSHYSYDEYLAYLLYQYDQDAVTAIKQAQPVNTRHLRQLIQKVRWLGLSNIDGVDRQLRKIYGESLKERVLTTSDYSAHEDELEELKQITIKIISKFSSLVRGFLIDFLKEVGQI
ncbi:MAG: hypothetical protein ACK40Q_02300 [Pseudothermotoga sp.]